MEIRSAPNRPLLEVAVTDSPALARAWSDGQLLEAVVTRVDARRGTALLQTPEGEVEAHSQIPLRPGMRLQLTVEANATQWLLRVRGNPTAETVAVALRRALPRATALAPLFDAIATLLQKPAALPAAVRLQAHALAAAQPKAEALTQADGLRSALRHSGLFMETHLADPRGSAPTVDLKARLLALIDSLAAPPPRDATPNPRDGAPVRGEPPPAHRAHLPSAAGNNAPAVAEEPIEVLATLLRHAEGALAQIQLHQLRALPDTAPSPPLLFELPLHWNGETHTLQLRFEREAERDGDGSAAAPGWRVTLDLSHPDHGALRAVVGWRGGAVTARFFAERPATAERVRDHLAALNQRLTAAGLTVTILEAHAGIPATAPPPAGAGLLSERA